MASCSLLLAVTLLHCDVEHGLEARDRTGMSDRGNYCNVPGCEKRKLGGVTKAIIPSIARYALIANIFSR